MARIIEAFKTFFDDEGELMAGGWVEFLESGSTSTQKSTYSDYEETTPNENPIQLDDAAQIGDVFGTGLYRAVSYKDSGTGEFEDAVQVDVFDPIGGTSTSSGHRPFDDYVSTTIYDSSDIVTASNGSYYRSKVSSNNDNEPSASPTQWELLYITSSAKYTALEVSELDDSATPSVLTVAETTNTSISNYKSSGADHVFQMPAAHVNGNVIFVIGDAYQITITPYSGENFYLNGAAMAADESIINSADTVGQYILGYVANIGGSLIWMFESKYSDFVEESP
jgi:hypothetical protein